jgi:hypothetical protein
LSALKAILIAAAFALFLTLGISSFNFIVDPMCYYQCDKVEPTRATSNSYYQAAQKILAHTDAEQILLGSSRAGTTSPHYLSKKTGLKTINLEVPGAEVLSKVALLNLSLEKNKLKRVIWYADFFEIIPSNIDEKLKSSQALRNLLGSSLASSELLRGASPLITLIDHNTVVASINTLKLKPLSLASELGGNSGEYLPCDKGSYEGKESSDSDEAWQIFEKAIRSIESRGVEVVIVIIPYHPDFVSRLTAEFPEIFGRHQQWVEKVNSISSGGIKVLDYSSGIPGGDGSPKYWNDGVHFTCNGAIAMLSEI